MSNEVFGAFQFTIAVVNMLRHTRSRSLCVVLRGAICYSARRMAVTITYIKQRAVIVSLPAGQTRTEAVYGFVTVDELDNGWKPSKYNLLCLGHFKESCFEEDISHRIVGQDPQKRRRRRALKHGAVQTILSHRPQSSKPRTFSVECAAKSEREKALLRLWYLNELNLVPLKHGLRVSREPASEV